MYIGGIEKKLIGERREMELVSVELDSSADSKIMGAWQAHKLPTHSAWIVPVKRRLKYRLRRFTFHHP
jgi:hypothetical protein